MGKVVIVQKNQKLLLFLIDESGRPVMIRMAAVPDAKSLVGNICIGRVQEIAEGIHAAFIAIGNDEKVFLALNDDMQPLLTNREYDGKLKAGDELVIQITTPALKTKLPTASTALSLTGQYCVCKRDGHGIALSNKLSVEKASEIKDMIKENDFPNRKKYGFVIRTNAGELENISPLINEMQRFTDFWDELLDIYKSRTLYSCLYHTEPEFVSVLKDIPISAYEEVVTDIPKVAKVLMEHQINTRIYQDEMLSLSALYSIETHLKQALDKQVWLPSGGYLVIEQTEAMVVIDVNSGKGSRVKNAGKKNLYLKINLEAAKEIARQLRLRNYSGMIMVDFINMESKEDQKKLLDSLDRDLKEDQVRTRLIDMTALGIVEITRKKVSRPLYDLMKENKE